jgi:hypothetical protein
MGPSIESTNTRRRNSENDGQILLGGGLIGITVRSRNVGSFQEDGRNAGRLPQCPAGPVTSNSLIFYGRIDILLTTPEEKSSETASTPFAIIEVGRHDEEWWIRLDQNMKYLANMGKHRPDRRLRFTKPLIFGVLTIEGEGDDDGSNLKVRLGVFFCSPKSTRVDDYRIMSLLWHSRTNDLTKGSKDFGRLLRVTSDFSDWRQEDSGKQGYEYLGPNCYKVVVDQVCSSAVVVCAHSLPNFLTPISSFATFHCRTKKQGTPELRHSLSSNAAKVGNI